MESAQKNKGVSIIEKEAPLFVDMQTMDCDAEYELSPLPGLEEGRGQPTKVGIIKKGLKANRGVKVTLTA